MTNEEMVVFELAESLGRTVTEVLEMSYDEFTGWLQYFKERPIGWREDYRFFIMMQAASLLQKNTKPWDVFPSLSFMRQSSKIDDGKLDITKLKKSGMFQMMMRASGGVNTGDLFNGDSKPADN